MTVLEALKGISRYPVPQSTFDKIALKRGMTLSSTATQSLLATTAYKYAEADVMMFLSTAPDITEGDVKFVMSKTEREALLNMANSILNSSSAGVQQITYGYQGENL